MSATSDIDNQFESSLYLTISLKALAFFKFDESLCKVAFVMARLHQYTIGVNEGNGDKIDPWFSVTYSKIRDWTFGMVSERKIQECISDMKDCGILLVRPRPNMSSQYLFMVDKFNTDIAAVTRDDMRIPRPTPKSVKSGQAPAATPENWESNGAAPGKQPCLPAGGNGADIHITNTYNSTENCLTLALDQQEDAKQNNSEPSENFGEETELTVDNICEWVLNRFRDRTTKQQFMPMGKTRKRIEAMFSDLGEFSFRKKLDEFLKGDSHLIEDFVSGRPVTSKNSLRRAPDSGRAVFDRRVATANTLFSRQGPPGAPNTQKRPNRPHTALTQQMVERWNELVPHRPATFEGERGYDIPMLEQMRMDTEFMDAFDGIAGKVEAIAANKGTEASWLTFSWILQFGKSGQNWGRVMRGEFDFMAAKPERRRKSQADDVTDDLIRRLESGEYKP